MQRNVLRRVIYRFDAFLSRQYGIFPFSDDPDCILRLQKTHASHRLALSGLVLEPGDAVVGFHLWNERMPPMPKEGASLGWAAHTRRLFFYSLRLAADAIRADEEMRQSRALSGATSIFTPGLKDNGANFFKQAGFIVAPYYRPLGAFGEFWENFYSWWIIWAYNPGGLKGLGLGHMRRTEIWIAMGEFLERYGSKEPASQPGQVAPVRGLPGISA
jgi:hypothetical protein